MPQDRQRQLSKDGRWICFKQTWGMFWKLEGTAPRQGVTDHGDVDARSKQAIGVEQAKARVDRWAAQHVKDGWVETGVGWAELPFNPLKQTATPKPAAPKRASPETKSATKKRQAKKPPAKKPAKKPPAKKPAKKPPAKKPAKKPPAKKPPAKKPPAKSRR